MGKVLTSESNYEDIADAIRSRIGGQNTYYPGEMGGVIRTMSPLVTNGVKQQLLSSSGIIPNSTFIELAPGKLNGIGMSLGSNTPYSFLGGANTTTTWIKRVSDTKALVVYVDNSSNAMATIVTISGDEIVDKGTAVRIVPDKGQSGSPRPSLVELPSTGSDKKFLVSYHYYSDQLGVSVITVATDGTISIGSTNVISTNFGAKNGASISPVVLSDSTFVSFYLPTVSSGGSLTGEIKAIPCTISGTTITAGTESTVASDYGTGGYDPYIYTCASGTSAILAYRTSDSNVSNKVVAMTVSNQAVTVGTPVSLSGSGEQAGLSVIGISGNRVVATAHGSTGQSGDYFTVYGVSGATLTALSPHTNVQIGNEASYSPRFTPIRTGDAEFLMFYASSGYRMTCAKIEVTNNNTFLVTQQSAVPGTGTYSFSGGVGLLSDGLALYSCARTSDYYTTLYLGTMVAPSAARPSQTRIDGITAGPITESTAGDVWVLNQGS